ncbi:helix-turn-helix domain-containing protein [Ramlibacter albus]|uniref:Helix-turn-helix transcriptional regulator n=1 Tax=Ramlibacter albus TaxID=2079448 RepID=A0A923S4U3_9BURK|nr:helix-turn-helix domain-containing protein [Ramlibacter albus]MBC5767258.1 helix-turn-helix transcriptional regulator [Ramlibacter albus]
MNSSNAGSEALAVNDLVAANLAYYMKARGLSQARLGERAGLTARTVANYLHPTLRPASRRGREVGGRLYELQKMADSLGVPCWLLLVPPPVRTP